MPDRSAPGDAWSTLLFANYKINEHLEIIGGIGLTYLAAGEINKTVQPGGFTAQKLVTHYALPLAWPEQRQALGFV